jgi:hypothetical protein
MQALTASFALMALASAGADLGVVAVDGADALPPDLAGAITLAATEASRAPVPPAEMQKNVDDARSLGVACALDDPACLSKIAATSNLAEVLAVRHVGGDAPALRVVRVDTAAATVLRQVEVTLAPDPRGRLDTARAAVRAVLLDEPLEGTLWIGVTPAGAEVVVDGRQRGLAPLAAPLTLPPGEHALEVRAAGAEPHTERVQIYAGAITRVDVTLPGAGAAAPAGAGGRAIGGPLTWTGVALLGVGTLAGAAGFAGALIVTPSRERRSSYESATAYNDAVGTGYALAVVGGVGASVAVVGAAVAGVGLVLE